jgi:hypothetical protein
MTSGAAAFREVGLVVVGECIEAIDWVGNYVWPLLKAKAVIREVMWLTRPDVDLDMTEEERVLWELGGGDEDEMEREHNEGKGEVGDGERKARVNGPDAGWHRDRHLDCKRRFGHVDFMQNYCWARREEVRYSWRQFTSRKRT